MQAIYPCAQLICLICAIIFVGFLFFGAIIFSRAKKKPSADIAQKAQQAASKRRDKDHAALRFAARSNGRYDDRRQGRLQGGRTFRLKFANRVYNKGLRRVYRAFDRCCKFDVQICSSLPGDIHRFAFASAALIAICAKITFIV